MRRTPARHGHACVLAMNLPLERPFGPALFVYNESAKCVAQLSQIGVPGFGGLTQAFHAHRFQVCRHCLQ